MKPLLAVSLLLFPLTIQAELACEAAFDAQRIYAGGWYFNDAFVADIDGDGLPDLLFATGEGPFVASGRGGGRFDPPIAIGEAYVSAVADVTGDALPDVITYTAAVRENRGGSFPSMVALGASGEYLAAVADFTNDGRADILTLDSTRLHPRLYTGGTLAGREITLQPPVNYRFAEAIGDIDHDGNPDLISSANSETKIRIDYGNGAGDFTRTESRVVDGLTANVVVADFDASGRDDIVFTTAAGGVQIMFDGETSVHPLAVDPAAGSAQVVDVNADGIPDLVTYGSGRIRVYRNDGHASFTLRNELLAANFALGDVDLDGVPDLVVAAEGGFAVVRGLGDGTFDTRRRDLAAGMLAASGDVDGDGLDELFIVTPTKELVARFDDGHTEMLPPIPNDAVITLAANGEVLVRSAHSLLVFARGNAGTWRTVRTLTRDTTGAMLADLDRDGKNEIALSATQGAVSLIEVLDDRTDAERFRAEVPLRPSFTFAAGDADEDGQLDLFAAANGTFATMMHAWVNRDGYLRMWRGAGGGTFGHEQLLIENESLAEPHLGDYNGDGHLDVAVITTSDYLRMLYVLMGDGDGAFVNRPPATAPPYIGNIATGDVNGDGIDDIATWIESELALYAGGPGGLAKRGSYWPGGSPGAGVLARLRKDAPLSAVFTFSDEATIGAIDGVCAPARRRGVRH